MEEKILVFSKSKTLNFEIVFFLLVGIAAALIGVLNGLLFSYIISGIAITWCFISVFSFRFSKIIVTDERIYGRLRWGQNTSIRMYSILSVKTLKFINGVKISTSSGTVVFTYLENYILVADTLRDLLARNK